MYIVVFKPILELRTIRLVSIYNAKDFEASSEESLHLHLRGLNASTQQMSLTCLAIVLIAIRSFLMLRFWKQNQTVLDLCRR